MVRWLVCVVLALGMLRAGAFLLHSPMLGLANNYDMIRVQGCIDAYPIRDPSIPAWSNSWEAPIERYAFRGDLDPGCFFTSEVLFAWAAWPFMRWQASRSEDGGFSLRTVGTVKFAAVWLLVGGVVAVLIRRRANGAALAIACVAALVLADPAVSQYLNTFYAEFAAVFFTTATVLLVLVAPTGRARWPYLILLATCAALACISKLQHVGIGLVLTACIFAARRFGQPLMPHRVFAALLVGGVLGFAAQLAHLSAGSTQSIRHANLTNVVLFTVLGESEQPRVTARHLGLPESCGDHAGKDWYYPGLQEAPPCPELLDMSRVRLVALVLMEPEVMLRVFAGGISRARAYITRHFGLVAGETQGRLPAMHPTWADALFQMPTLAVGVLLLLPFALGMAALVLKIPLGHAPGFAWLACALLPATVLTVVIIGDGYEDTGKHFHLGMTAALAFWVVTPGWLAAWMRRKVATPAFESEAAPDAIDAIDPG
jgi:hypothetical protein